MLFFRLKLTLNNFKKLLNLSENNRKLTFYTKLRALSHYDKCVK